MMSSDRGAPQRPPTRRVSDLRRTNAGDVIDLLRAKGRLSRAELAEHTTLSNQALATILNELVEIGFVVEVEPRGAPRGRGRPALLYAYNADRVIVASLYVGLRYAAAELCDGLGRVLADSGEFAPGWDVERLADEAGAQLLAMMEQRNLDPRRCHVAAVVHGDVDTATGVVSAEGMGWHDVPLADLLEERIGAGVTVHDVARAAAVAEHREGVARGAHRAVVFNVGPEFTASQIVDGTLDRGWSGRAGMLGRCRVPTPAGVVALDDYIGSVVAKKRYEELSGRRVDWMADVHGLARAGDPHALAVMADQADALAYVSGWLINVTDPEVLVLTGSIGEFDEATKARLIAAIVDHADPRVLRHCAIRLTTMGRQAWLRGGVHCALEHQRALERSAD